MQNTASYLNDVHAELARSDDTLSTARSRRDEVLAKAKSYPGALRTYKSGSIAHRTANQDTDADCGVVLDRRSYPKLGPDGEGEGPNQTVEDVRGSLRDELKEDHPDIRFRVTKRAIQVSFNDPLDDGSDPSVDLIVTLTRKGQGLWIPNNEAKDWDASDPEYHTKVLTADPAGLRRVRAKIIRLAKGWNSQYAEPGLCSFNIEALALSCIGEEHGVPDGLAELFRFAASDLKKRLTPRPRRCLQIHKAAEGPRYRRWPVGAGRWVHEGRTGQRRRRDEGAGGDGESVLEICRSTGRERFQRVIRSRLPQRNPRAWCLRRRTESRHHRHH